MARRSLAHRSGVGGDGARTGRAVLAVVPCARIGVSVIGLEVPHAHVHLLPISQLADMTFKPTPIAVSPEEMEALRTAIAARVEL